MLMLVSVMAFAGGISEQSVRNEYQKKGGFPNRDAWLYEFNSVANEVKKDSEHLLKGEYPELYKKTFDNECVEYKVLLDIGVELGYINDKTRQQQIAKAEEIRKKVSQYLTQYFASQSSGLGLE
jgi:hypothetical protein